MICLEVPWKKPTAAQRWLAVQALFLPRSSTPEPSSGARLLENCGVFDWSLQWLSWENAEKMGEHGEKMECLTANGRMLIWI